MQKVGKSASTVAFAFIWGEIYICVSKKTHLQFVLLAAAANLENRKSYLLVDCSRAHTHAHFRETVEVCVFCTTTLFLKLESFFTS